MTDVSSALARVHERIRAAERASHRLAGSVGLLAVSKTQPASALAAAYDCGQRAFGENYLQEALGKQADLTGLELQWHFIGPLQANKTKLVAEHFDWVHSIDRSKLLLRLNAQRPVELPPLNVCLQVKVDPEESKSGAVPEAIPDLAALASDLPRLRLRGLMAIPAPRSEYESQRQAFRQVATLAERLRAAGYEMDTLSMGMSADLEAAIAEGATLVRIGSAIFGQRPR